MPDFKVIEGKFGHQAPAGLAADLRRLADQVDRGEVKEICAIWVDETDQSYTYLWGTSLWNALGMSDLLHQQALDRVRTPL